MPTEFDPPERFIAGTVGLPGERVFFLQARRGARVMSVSLEKQQVQLLGERLETLLDQVAEAQSTAELADAVADNAPMDTPIEDEFRVQALSMLWDPVRAVVVVEAHEVAEEDEEDSDEEGNGGGGAGAGDLDAESARTSDGDRASLLATGAVMRVVLEPAQARAFARRCAAAVAGGRPNCPFCGQPLDPTGHICPRANGYKR